jgi:hypothetical protein
MQYLAQANQSTPDLRGVTAAIAAMGVTIAIVVLVSVAVTVLIWFMIFNRTGMNPWLSLLMLVPIANFVMLIVLAFNEWPVQRELRMLRAQAGSGYYPGPTPPPPPTAYSSQLPPPPTPPTVS